ncbi:MAG: single-stranded-DNA-specific exonuclease RecJ [Candidatus Campbellbacteria bacterium]|nr:single-stranded-DNA-specific exonuclease RecJ [Candidatus Campbellbacteria bacterium]
MNDYQLREPISPSISSALSEYDSLTKILLSARGINSSEEAEEFLNVEYKTHDPMLFMDMKKAVDRFNTAIKNNEKIVVFCDYDGDGIPAAALMSSFFQLIKHDNVIFRIPDRHSEGYGLSEKIVEEFDDVSLIILIDCGIRDNDAIESANKKGIDTIVIDHHLPSEKLPNAFAIINPKREEDSYPEEDLCGCALAFKFVQGVLSENRYSLKEGAEKWLLDLVAIATVADMVPLRGENRILARFGLIVLRKTQRYGLRSLMSILKRPIQSITEDDIGFVIAPRINSASRIGDPYDAFKMLSSNDPAEAHNLAVKLNDLNKRRQGLVASVTKTAKKVAETKDSSMSVWCFGQSDWRPSIAGLVASSLVDQYNKPVFVWGRSGSGTIKGSCRAPNGVNLIEIMNKAQESKNIFTEYGGHKVAGGFTIDEKKLFEVEAALSVAFEKIPSESEEGEKIADAVLSFDTLTEIFNECLSKFAPFGRGNEKPLFVFEDVYINNVTKFGIGGRHVRYELKDKKGNVAKGISFFSSVLIEEGSNTTLVAYLESSLNSNKPSLRIIDYKKTI